VILHKIDQQFLVTQNRVPGHHCDPSVMSHLIAAVLPDGLALIELPRDERKI